MMATNSQFPNMQCVLAEREDIGASEERARGVNTVKTDRFVNMDG